MAMVVTIVVVVAAAGAGALGYALRTRRALVEASRRGQALEAGLAEQRTVQARRDALLRMAVETSPIAMVLFADTGRITFTNLAARELFFEGGSVEGQNFLAMVERAPEALRRALLSASSELFTVEGPAGSETFHLSRQQLDGQTLIAVRNVTNEVTRQEIDALKKVIRIIGHEVGNSLGPIASMIGSATMILAKPEQLPRLGSIFETIKERTTHLQTFLEGYAKLAKIPEPQPAPVEWAPFVAELRALWPELPAPRLPARAGFFDKSQIQQVLINLIKNAYEAGGPRSEVVVDIERPAEGGIRVAVLDRGQGISDEALASALLPFYTTKPTGSGLGLALCREIVDLHRGRLKLARRDGGGMAVSIWLPDRDGGTGPAGAASQARLTLTRR
jgi:signal transduction histidine kinase